MKPTILLYISLFWLSIISVKAYNHQGSIVGAIYHSETKEPLVGANILLLENKAVAVSDLFGVFRFQNLPAGKYTLQVTYIGFETQTYLSEVKDSESSNLKIQLKASTLNLADITVQTNQERNLNVINAIDIQLRPVNTSQDILKVVPGLFIAQHAGGGKAEQIFLRGFDIDHGTDITLSMDGMPVNMVSHAHGQGYADFHFVIPELVEQVGFEKGLYYAQKGNFNTAGYVEFNTRRALDKSMFKLEAGQYDSYRVVAMLDLLGEKAKENQQNAYLATEYSFTNGYFESPQNFNRLNIFGKYRQLLDNNKIITFSFSTFRSVWDASGQVPDRAVREGLIGRFGAIDNTEGGQTSRTNFNLQFTQMLHEQTSMHHQLYFINYQFELYSNFTFFLHDPINGDQIRQKENRNIYGYKTTFQNEMKLARMTLISEAGLEIRHDEIRNNELTRTIARRIDNEAITLGDIDETNASVFWKETLYLTPKLSVQAGVRADYFNFSYIDKLSTTFERQLEAKVIVSPKLNINYDISKNLSFYVKSGTGFHSNDTRVVVAQSGKEILPKAFGTDVGIIFKPYPSLMIQTAVWYLQLDQEFVYVGDEGVVEAGGKTHRKGLDISLRWQLMPWLLVDTDVNLTQPKAMDVPENENKIPLAPTFTSIGGCTIQLKNGFNASLRYRYMQDRPANEDNSVVAEGYFLMDAVLNYTRPKYQLGISIQNMLNTAWKEAQFDTESSLKNEIEPVSEIHYTPGSPFFIKGAISLFF
jgi:outer membrane receptor protein involved in Fe transport